MIKEFEDIISNHKKFKKFYSIKKKIFPIKKCIEFFPDSGRLIDLGCGNGIFAGLLSLYYPNLEIIGIDDDERKINEASTVFKNLKNIRFLKNDITKTDFPEGDHFSLFDVLYLIPYNIQAEILSKINKSMTRDGILIIKEMDRKPFYKYLFNILQETISVKLIKITLGNKFYFRNSDCMIDLLKKDGFVRIEVVRIDRGYLYPHIIYRASKN